MPRAMPCDLACSSVRCQICACRAKYVLAGQSCTPWMDSCVYFFKIFPRCAVSATMAFDTHFECQAANWDQQDSHHRQSDSEVDKEASAKNDRKMNMYNRVWDLNPLCSDVLVPCAEINHGSCKHF